MERLDGPPGAQELRKIFAAFQKVNREIKKFLSGVKYAKGKLSPEELKSLEEEREKSHKELRSLCTGGNSRKKISGKSEKELEARDKMCDEKRVALLEKDIQIAQGKMEILIQLEAKESTVHPASAPGTSQFKAGLKRKKLSNTMQRERQKSSKTIPAKRFKHSNKETQVKWYTTDL